MQKKILFALFCAMLATNTYGELNFGSTRNQNSKANMWTGHFSMFGLPVQQISGKINTINDIYGDDLGFTHGEELEMRWLFQKQPVGKIDELEANSLFMEISLLGATNLNVADSNQPGRRQFPEEISKLWIEMRLGYWNFYGILGTGIKYKNFDNNGLAFFTATNTRDILHDLIGQEITHIDSGKDNEFSGLFKVGIGGQWSLVEKNYCNLLFDWNTILSLDTYDTFKEEGLSQTVAITYGIQPIRQRQISWLTLSGEIENRTNFEDFDSTVRASIGFNQPLNDQLFLGVSLFMQHGIYDGIRNGFEGKNEILSGIELVLTYNTQKKRP